VTDLVAIDCTQCSHCSKMHADTHTCEPNICPCAYAAGREQYEPEFAGCLMIGTEFNRRFYGGTKERGTFQLAVKAGNEGTARRRAAEADAAVARDARDVLAGRSIPDHRNPTLGGRG
jgi:hypothetical protein